MILSKTKEDRAKALKKLLPHQKQDFMKIFKIMKGLPVTVRLLDPPLHEFLPNTEKEILEVANVVGVDSKEVEIENMMNYMNKILCLVIGVVD